METSRRPPSSRRREVAVNQSAQSLRVDRNSPVPLYFQVAQHLEQLIESGDLPTGARLENEIDLADQLGLSRPTMRRAIAYLVDRGLLVRKRGVGTQVAPAKVRRQVELTSLYDDLAKAGRAPVTRVLSFERQPLPEDLAPDLGLPAGSEVYVFERLRSADDEPLALLRNYVPADLLALTAEDLEHHGLYNLLRGSGCTLRIARESIGAGPAALVPSTAEALEPPGRYNRLRGRGFPLRIARQSIGARAATTAEARTLG